MSRRPTEPVLLVLLAVLLGACPPCLPAGPGPRKQEAVAKQLHTMRRLQSMLDQADTMLVGSDNSLLDVQQAVQLLQQVHAHVSRVFDTAVMQSSAVKGLLVAVGPAGREQVHQHVAQDLHGRHDDQRQHQHTQQRAAIPTSSRGTSKTRRLRRSRPAAAWQELGRASYTLAALSASGLISEYLPHPQASPAAAAAALCRRLQAAVTVPARGTAQAAGQGSGSSSSAGCMVVATEPRVLQELEWLLTAAAAGTTEAQLALADRFLMGRGGVAASCAEGLAWLQRAAGAVMLKAQKAGNWDLNPSFIRLRERFTDMSSPQSYSEWDEQQMAEELQAAAAFGSADTYAQRRLGYRLLLGRGVPVDHRSAFEHFVAAADVGRDGYALYNLGYMYLKGWHVARDPPQALQYFKSALERGVGAAANAIGVLAAHGEAMPADLRAAARWFEKGANMSDPDSIFNLGTLYLHGRGVPQDAQAALSYYGMAFDLGHWKAPYALGQLYAGDEPGLGHNCEYAEKYFWQFVSQRSGWVPAAQAALHDYDRPSLSTSHHQAQDGSKQAIPTAGSSEQRDSAANGQPYAAGGGFGVQVAAVAAADRHLQALLRYLLLAESGCEAAAENAAWMLLHGQGASGPRAVGLAAHLLYRSAILNHTSSMIELAHLLLNESIIRHPQQLQQAVDQSGAFMSRARTASPGTAAAASTYTNVTLGLLHHVLLQQPNAFMPPVAGATACTGFYRRSVAALVFNVSNTTTALPTSRGGHGARGHQRQQAGLSEGAAGGSSIDAAGLVVLRARRAAVAWLFEASSVGDAEAAALLGWLWHEGVLQGSRAQQEALAVIQRALTQQPLPGHQYALQLAQTVIWLEQQASKWLGVGPAAAVRSVVVAARDAAVRLHGMHPCVLDMTDGLASVHPAITGRTHRLQPSLLRWRWWAWCKRLLLALQHGVGATALQQQAAVEGGRGADGRGPQQAGHGWWEFAGADRVDKDNLVLTCLMGALAGVLWLHVRQQGRRAAAALGQGAQGGGDAAVAPQDHRPAAQHQPPAGGAAGAQTSTEIPTAAHEQQHLRQRPRSEREPGATEQPGAGSQEQQ